MSDVQDAREHLAAIVANETDGDSWREEAVVDAILARPDLVARAWGAEVRKEFSLIHNGARRQVVAPVPDTVPAGLDRRLVIATPWLSEAEE